jgi:spermidine synthase
MIPWVIIDSASVPGQDGVIRLYQRGREFSICIDERELMASGIHGSETALAEETIQRLRGRSAVRILVGGLGMGYTLAAALRVTDAESVIEVAELMPAVVAWNRGPLAHLAGAPLSDPRVRVLETDVAAPIRDADGLYDAILLDVDNGPRALTSPANAQLYSPDGLAAAGAALTPGGILAVWSAGPDPSFTSRLERADFKVEQLTVRARGARGGRKYHLWLATI